MKTKTKDNSLQQPILKGVFCNEAKYIKQEILEYDGNPLIEALPQIFSEEDIYKAFYNYPDISEGEKKLESRIKNHIIVSRLKRFLQPLRIHFDVEKKISIMIRQGYIARNINSVEFKSRLKSINELKQIKEKEVKFEIIESNLRSTAACCSIIGVSGIGKTTAIERLLAMYPQVIVHKEYNKMPILYTQIVWLKIDCPFDGSLKTLCKIFFRAVDNILGGTNYFTTYGSQRNSVSTMMIHMTYVATLHSIGLLAIDEIQHLLGNRYNSDEILSFFTTLTNTIGVPSILIGTPKALEILKKDFRHARRASGYGNIDWDRMRKNDEWDFFLNTMWKYQWLDNFTSLNNGLNEAMYYETQGITSVAVDLFILVQERALEQKEQIITVKLIRNTAKKDLSLIQEMLNALRSGNKDEIRKYADIAINVEEIIQNIRASSDTKNRVEEFAKLKSRVLKETKISIRDNIITDIINIGTFPLISYDKLQEIIETSIKIIGVGENESKIKQEVLKACLEENQRIENAEEVKQEKKNKRKSATDIKDNDDLRKLFNVSQKKNLYIYDVLAQHNYIKDSTIEFLGDINIC